MRELCAVPRTLWKRRIASSPQSHELIRWDDSLYLWHDSVFLHLLLIPVDIHSVYMSGKTMGLISTHVGWQQQPGMSLKSDLLCYSEAVNNWTLRFMSLMSVVTVFHSKCFSLKATKWIKLLELMPFCSELEQPEPLHSQAKRHLNQRLSFHLQYKCENAVKNIKC